MQHLWQKLISATAAAAASVYDNSCSFYFTRALFLPSIFLLWFIFCWHKVKKFLCEHKCESMCETDCEWLWLYMYVCVLLSVTTIYMFERCIFFSFLGSKNSSSCCCYLLLLYSFFSFHFSPSLSLFYIEWTSFKVKQNSTTKTVRSNTHTENWKQNKYVWFEVVSTTSRRTPHRIHGLCAAVCNAMTVASMQKHKLKNTSSLLTAERKNIFNLNKRQLATTGEKRKIK